MILVTGGTGFVGAHLLVQLLNKGKTIRAIRRSDDLKLTRKIFSYYFDDVENAINNIEWIDADILDINALKDVFKDDITEVYHCAATVSFNPKDKQKMMAVNINGTANIVNLSLIYKVKKLCHVSSIAALGRTELPESFVTEDTHWKQSKQNSNYAVSKYGGEREVWRGIQEGLDSVIVNPSVILGPGDWSKGSAQIFSTLAKGTMFYTKGVNGYVDVKDVAKAMIALMDSDIINEHFILSAENLSYQDLFSKMLIVYGKKVPTVHATRPLLEVGWRAEKIKSFLTGISPLITKETARTSRNKYNYSSDKIIKALDFAFTPIDKTIKDTCELYLKEK